jgi:hypothetical protein
MNIEELHFKIKYKYGLSGKDLSKLVKQHSRLKYDNTRLSLFSKKTYMTQNDLTVFCIVEESYNQLKSKLQNYHKEVRKSEITNEVLYLTYNLDIKKLFDFDNMYVPSLYNRVLADLINEGMGNYRLVRVRSNYTGWRKKSRLQNKISSQLMWAYSKNHLLDDRLDKIIINTLEEQT